MIGKSIFIWNIEDCFDGDIPKIVDALQAGRFQSAILHSVNLDSWASDNRKNLTMALRNAGIHPIGGAAVYGADPGQEGFDAAQLCATYDLDTFVFDVEARFDAVSNSDSAVTKLLQTFKQWAPNCKAGFCWWPMYQSQIGASWHPKKVLWAAMDPNYGDADFGMPMMYWNWGNDAFDAEKFAEESLKQWYAITDKPLVPVGRAYIGDGGVAMPPAILAFYDLMRKLEGIEGIAWWSMQHALDTKALPGVWGALASRNPFGWVVEPEPNHDAEVEVIATVKAARINFRSTPEVKTGNALGLLNRGTSGTILERKTDSHWNTWVRVSVEGWLSEKYYGSILTEVE